jgi:hypothetical protein
MSALVHALVPQIEREHRAALGAAASAIQHAIECGRLLLQAKAALAHGAWLAWVEANLSFGGRQARKYMRLALRCDQIGIENADLTIDGCMELLAERDNGHFRTSFSGDPEWYTPPATLRSVRHVLGKIDLDPASNDMAQRQVRAAEYFTREDDGLSRDWRGRVFMNPPFAHPAIEQFIDKLLAELSAGHVTEAITLTNSSSDTRWFRKAADAAAALCLTKGRIRFASSNRNNGPPILGQAFFYFGPNVARFADAFGSVGSIWVRYTAT